MTNETQTLAKKTRAEINRENAQKSTGPKTPEGKAASRANALKHGLTATTLAPTEAPGEAPGAYQARLDFWLEDLKPRNVLELVMVQRACRASWKLDRCARYEDAAAARRAARGEDSENPDEPSALVVAERMGTLLMFVVEEAAYHDFDDDEPCREPNPYDNAPRDADALCRFKEGVEWLLRQWAQVLPYLTDPGEPPAEGAEAHRERMRARALRLLGVPTGAPTPPQSLREAGEAEVRRLEARLAEFAASPGGRAEADLALLGAGPESQLLLRYEAGAERELHRAVNTFLKLRQNPELVVAPDTDPPDAPETPAPSDDPPPPPQARPRRPGGGTPRLRNEASSREQVTTNPVSNPSPERSSPPRPRRC